MPQQSAPARSLTPRLSAFVLTVMVAVVTLVPVGSASAETAAEEWVFRGGGWGHGVGMSQYGAYGMALDGADAAQILDHYYSGAKLEQLVDRNLPDWWDDPYPVVIGLVQKSEKVTLRPYVGTASVCQETVGGGPCSTPMTIPTSQPWTVETRSGGRCVVVDHTSATVSEGSCEVDVTWEDNAAESPFAVNRLKVDAGEYAHGSVRILPAATSGKVDVVLDIEMEQYLRGLAEMPSTWPQEALAAQVIAARNYTIRRVLDTGDNTGNPTRACQCHLYRDTRDQAYLAWSKEGLRPNGWVDAVEATVGVVATHPPSGQGVFTAYYSSSTGGSTQSVQHVWGGSALPYLRTVDDHWAVSAAVSNPYAHWERTFDAGDVAARLGWDAVVGIDLVQGAPHAVVRFAGVDGGEEVVVELRGDKLRTKFDLRSSQILEIDGPGAETGLRDIGASVHAADILFIAELGITKGCNPPANTLFCPGEPVTRGQMAAFLVRALGLGGSADNHFVDDDDSLFENDIALLARAGITQGCNPPTNDQFCPDRRVNRGEMAAFLSRAFSLSAELEPSDNSESQTEGGNEGERAFFDPGFVDDDRSVFRSEIAALAYVGVTHGCNPPSNDRYCPDGSVTREQMASFIARALR